MGSREKALEALTFVLVEKIYSLKPTLMRNDTLTASLVVKYVSAMISEYYNSRYIVQKTIFQHDASTAYYEIYPLEFLGEETIRKYIAMLWKLEVFSDIVEFRKVNSIDD